MPLGLESVSGDVCILYDRHLKHDLWERSRHESEPALLFSIYSPVYNVPNVSESILNPGWALTGRISVVELPVVTCGPRVGDGGGVVGAPPPEDNGLVPRFSPASQHEA